MRPERSAPDFVVIGGKTGSASRARFYISSILFWFIFPLSWSACPPPFQATLSLPGSRYVPTMDRSVLSFPNLRQPRAIPVRWRFSCAGDGIMDFGTTNLPTLPPCQHWYGLAPVSFPTRGLEMAPSPVILAYFPGTTYTTVVGVVSSLVVLVPPSCFVESRDFPFPLCSLSVQFISYPPSSPVTSARVHLKGEWVAPSASIFARLAPPRVTSGARAFSRLSE